ncbi:MAG: pyridoxal-phosphate dependent enzyme [Candidatus Limnocylindrales bacterium]
MPDRTTVTIADILAAREVIAGRVHRTPLLSSAAAAAAIERSTGVAIADGRLYVKGEHLQKTGSFKARGMTARVAGLTPPECERGIITVSAGNAAQGYAFAGAAFGVPVTVVMPAAANPAKAAAAAGYGARVILDGETMSETFATLYRIRDDEGLTFCHPFDDAAVVAGHGSAGLELLEDLPDVDVVVVGIGGGGLISGMATAIRETRPGVRVYGVEPELSDAMSVALAAGKPVPIQPTSIADGLNAPFAGEITLDLVRRYVDAIVRIDDATILGGMQFALARMKQVVEPAGAAALAATLFGRVPIRAGERVAVVLSGGNVDPGRIGELIARAAPLPG